MPDYHFTGAFPRLLAGLSQGVNAWLSPADEDVPPYGSTIEAHTGDALHTSEPYQHPELEEVESDPVTEPAAAPAEPVVPIALVAAEPPAPVAEPAHDTMTAEGAPAPAETQE